MINFIWKNLPKTIEKEIVEPLKDYLSAEDYKNIKEVLWYNLPNKLTTIFYILVENYNSCSETPYNKPFKFIWYNLPKTINQLVNLKDALIECLQVPQLEIKTFEGIWVENFEVPIDCVEDDLDPELLETFYYIESGEESDIIYYDQGLINIVDIGFIQTTNCTAFEILEGGILGNIIE